jgi:hypothetical protein
MKKSNIGKLRKNLILRLSVLKYFPPGDFTIVIFGAGNTSALYQKGFQREGIIPDYYIDNDISKQNTFFLGKRVISLNQLLRMRPSLIKPVLIVICSENAEFCNQIKKQLLIYHLDFITANELFFSKNRNKIISVFDQLYDDKSRKIYYEVIKTRLDNSIIPESIVSSDQYFCLPEFSYTHLAQRDVFVDCGAYTGDTIEKFIKLSRLRNEWALSEDKTITEYAGVGYPPCNRK